MTNNVAMILTLYLDFYTYMNIFVGQIPRSEIVESKLYTLRILMAISDFPSKKIVLVYQYTRMPFPRTTYTLPYYQSVKINLPIRQYDISLGL